MDTNSAGPLRTNVQPHPQPVTVALADINLLDRHLLGIIILFAFTIHTCLVGIRTLPKLGDHEAINALAARDALVHGRWLIPYAGDEPGVRKTPLGIWAIAAASKLVQPAVSPPVTDLTARLPSAIAAIVTAMTLYWLGAMLYGHRAGLVAGFISASCAATIYFARNAQVEQILAMFTTLSFAFFWRGAMHAERSHLFMAGFYVSLALAMMAKAPLPLVTVGLSLAVYWFVTLPLVEAFEPAPIPKSWGRRWAGSIGHRFRALGRLWILPGLLLFVLLAGAWPLYVYFKVDNAIELWRIEYLERFTGEMDGRGQPAWYYVPLIFALTFPFLASIPEAVVAIFLPRYAAHRRAIGLALTWALVTTVFLSASAFKRPHYLPSAIPAYCLLLAPVIDRLFFGTLLASLRTVRFASAAIPLVIGGLWAGAVWYAQQELPEASKLLALGLGAAGFCWILSALSFYALCRRASFALLVLGIPLMLATTIPRLGATISVNPEADALVEAFDAHGIPPEITIYWTDGRPNSAVEFYSGRPVRRLMDVLEAAAIREGGRQEASPHVKRSIADEIRDRLAGSEPVYFIMSKDNYQMLATTTTIPHKVAFEITDAHPDPADALVVFTQIDRGFDRPSDDEKAGEPAP